MVRFEIDDSILFSYVKLSNKRLMVVFEEARAEQHLQPHEFNLLTNLDIKVSCLPFIFQRENFQHQMLQIQV